MMKESIPYEPEILKQKHPLNHIITAVRGKKEKQIFIPFSKLKSTKNQIRLLLAIKTLTINTMC